MSLAVSIKDREYISDRIASRIVADVTSKENTTQQVYFVNEQVDTIQDVSMPRMFLSKNIHSSTKEEDLSKRWGLSIPQSAITLKETTQNMTRY